MNETISDVRCHVVDVTPKTRWTFIEIVDAAGNRGVGEATIAGHDAEVSRTLEAHRHALVGRTAAASELAPMRAAATTLPDFAVVSALDQALWDLAGQRAQRSVADVLGGRRRERVDVYANVNRVTALRTPDGFAAVAARAVAEGFHAVKIAPFDGIELYGDTRKTADAALVGAAFARINAVRRAVRDETILMVDCHWRLNARLAEEMIDALEDWDVAWVECPLPESPEFLVALRALRSRANDRGMRLAGCEEMSLVGGFMPFLEAGAYDVMMPDVKYAGGMREMMAVADVLRKHKVQCAPHNPSGPVAHAASLQLCAAADVELLEMQYRETPSFDTLVVPSLAAPVSGVAAIPARPGLGVRLVL